MDNKRKIEKILDRGEKSAWKWAKKKGFEKGWPEIPARAASIAPVLDVVTVNLMKKLSLMNPGMEVVVENVEQNIWKSIIRGIRQQETNLYIERKRLPDMGLLTSVKIKNFLAMSPLFVPDASSLRTGSIYLAGYFDAKPVYVATGFGDEILLFPLPSLHGLIEERSGILTCSAAYLIWQENRWVAHETYSVTDESFYSLVRVVVKDIWYRKLLAWIKSRF
jgi:hypothetical protein